MGLQLRNGNKLVQLWVTRETRKAIKIKAALAGDSVVKYLEEHFDGNVKETSGQVLDKENRLPETREAAD